MINYNLSKANPLGGPEYRVQIDETLMRGRRKYHRGRLLQGDRQVNEDL